MTPKGPCPTNPEASEAWPQTGDIRMNKPSEVPFLSCGPAPSWEVRGPRPLGPPPSAAPPSTTRRPARGGTGAGARGEARQDSRRRASARLSRSLSWPSRFPHDRSHDGLWNCALRTWCLHRQNEEWKCWYARGVLEAIQRRIRVGKIAHRESGKLPALHARPPSARGKRGAPPCA